MPSSGSCGTRTRSCAARSAASATSRATGRAAGLPASRRADRARPRRGPGQHRRQVEQARLPSRQGRAPLPGRRPGKPAGRPRPGSRLGESPHRAGRRRNRTRPPRGSPSRRAHQRRARRDPGPRRRPEAVWDAPSTTDKDRKQLLRTLLDEVNIAVHRDHDSGLTWSCAGKAGRSPSWPSPSSAHPRADCAPMRAPST